jgi:hypothetical protein
MSYIECDIKMMKLDKLFQSSLLHHFERGSDLDNATKLEQIVHNIVCPKESTLYVSH